MFPETNAAVPVSKTRIVNQNPAEVNREYGVTLSDDPGGGYDCIVGAVGHRAYRAMEMAEFEQKLKQGGTIADLKGIWRGTALPAHAGYWSL